MTAFWAFPVFGDLVLKNGVFESLDQHVAAFGAVGVFVFVSLNVSDVRVVDAFFLCHVVSFLEGFDGC